MLIRPRRIWRDERGAVAPTVALSLVGLIAAGGIAFDYARMVSLNTELQDAADQAALAAAGQLDGTSGACQRAAAAASALLTNKTIFANDGQGLAVSVANEGTCDAVGDVRFYQSYDSGNDTFGSAATGDSNARVVQVRVGGRTANFALTPIVGALSSGSISASAVATLSSALCNTPALMICVPDPSSFPNDSDIGKGLRLQPGPSVGAWAPGNYGYLDFLNGASGLKINLGSNNDASSGCVDNSDGIDTEPGNKASVTDALNSRMDLYPNASAACNPATGDYCPSQNTRKDLAFIETVSVKRGYPVPKPGDNPGCGAPGAVAQNPKSQIDKYGFDLTNPATQGFTRDLVHYSGSTDNLGDGNWDRTGYFAALHPLQLAAAAAWAGKTVTTITRYDVFRWELADPADRLANTSIAPPPVVTPPKKAGGQFTFTYTNQCAYPTPKNAPPGVAISEKQKDRRILTAAAVDCTNVNGKSKVIVQGLVDLFLVEPSIDRKTADGSLYDSGKEQIYVEIIGHARKPNGQPAYQYYLKQRPRLIR